MVAHLQFLQTHKAKQKTAKELPSQRTTTRQWIDKQQPRKKNEGITRIWQKWRFSAKLKLCSSCQTLCFQKGSSPNSKTNIQQLNI